MKTIPLGDVTLNCLDHGQGRPLLLVHGFPLDHTMWRRQIDALAPVARVIAPDLRGFGKSSVSQGVVSMEQFADDLNALLTALQIPEKIVFCGLSMGGYIAWQFCRKYPDRVGKLIVCDTRAAADTPEAAAARRTMADHVLDSGPEELVKGMMERLFCPASAAKIPDDLEALRRTMLASPRHGVAAAMRGMADRDDATHWLASIHVPTLVIVGEHDAITPAAEMRRIAEAIPAARYVEVADAGHMAPLENPDAVNAAIREFLQRPPTST